MSGRTIEKKLSSAWARVRPARRRESEEEEQRCGELPVACARVRPGYPPVNRPYRFTGRPSVCWVSARRVVTTGYPLSALMRGCHTERMPGPGAPDSLRVIASEPRNGRLRGSSNALLVPKRLWFEGSVGHGVRFPGGRSPFRARLEKTPRAAGREPLPGRRTADPFCVKRTPDYFRFPALPALPGAAVAAAGDRGDRGP